jgi:hypothetical protein
VQKTLFADSVKGVPKCNAIRSLDAQCTYELKETLDIFASASLRQNFQRYFNQCNVAYPPLSRPAPIALPGKSDFINSAFASSRPPLNRTSAETILTGSPVTLMGFRLSTRPVLAGLRLSTCAVRLTGFWLSTDVERFWHGMLPVSSNPREICLSPVLRL